MVITRRNYVVEIISEITIVKMYCDSEKKMNSKKLYLNGVLFLNNTIMPNTNNKSNGIL